MQPSRTGRNTRSRDLSKGPHKISNLQRIGSCLAKAWNNLTTLTLGQLLTNAANVFTQVTGLLTGLQLPGLAYDDLAMLGIARSTRCVLKNRRRMCARGVTVYDAHLSASWLFRGGHQHTQQAHKDLGLGLYASKSTKVRKQSDKNSWKTILLLF